MALDKAADAVSDLGNKAAAAGKNIGGRIIRLPWTVAKTAFKVATSKPVLIGAAIAAGLTLTFGAAAAPAVAQTLASLPEPGTLGGLFSNAAEAVSACWEHGPPALKASLA